VYVNGWEGVDWTVLAHAGDKWQALVNAAMNFQVPKNARNFMTNSGMIKFSRIPLLRVVA